MDFHHANLGFNFPSNQSAWLEHHLVAARQQLGEEEFVVTYAEGQRMTLDQAVN